MGATVTLLDQSSRITYTQELVTETCCNCGIPFAMPRSLKDECHKDHSKSFYCPNGHSMVYMGKTDAERERDRADAATRRAKLAEETSAFYRKEAQAQKRQAAAYKGQLTRARKRAGAGVCPVTDCQRTVRQLADHMATKHPGYTP
jgi:hypothetical protein